VPAARALSVGHDRVETSDAEPISLGDGPLVASAKEESVMTAFCPLLRRHRLATLALAATTSAVALATPTEARALDKFEIQVYQADINEPGHFGLELHTNYTFSGHAVPSYDGETPPNHALRLTLEPAVGITDFLELGAYLQFMHTPYAGTQWGGTKVRAKFVVPERAHLPIFLGVNFEIGRVPVAAEQDGWANEIRPIIGWTNGYFLFDVNPIFGYALTGPDAFRPEFEPAFKAGWNTQLGFMLGAEYYAGLGRFDQGFLPRTDQEHLLFATFDLAQPVNAKSDDGWELNAGIGHGLTDATPQHWVFKMIVGHAF
jgi:hypothetical protein